MTPPLGIGVHPEIPKGGRKRQLKCIRSRYFEKLKIQKTYLVNYSHPGTVPDSKMVRGLSASKVVDEILCHIAFPRIIRINNFRQ